MRRKKMWRQRAAACVITAAFCVGMAGAVFAESGASAASGAGGTPPSGMTAAGGQDGSAPQGTPPDGTGGGGTAPSGGQGGAAPAGGGADTMTYDYSGTLSGALTADGESVASDGETTTADTADQNAALVENGGTLTLTDGTLTKSGDDTNGDNCNFYGINSILLAVGEGSTAKISGSTLTASSEGSNGVFATDNGTAYVYHTSIATTAGNSRGLDATYGGTIIADSLNISTQGDHCAALATDRGGGYLSVTNSSLSTAGSGSPLLYSTGDIEVDSVTGTASGSQIAGMEGLNTILIYNSSLTSTLTGATASDPIADGVILYQSTSGDAESTTGEAASFQAVDSTLSSAIESGAMFYITNTTANVVLKGTTLDFDADKANLLTIEGNDANNWGTAGSNGGTVTFTGIGETLAGNISVDTISSLDLYLLEGTSYTGTVSIAQNAVNTNASQAPVTVNLDGTSKWIVTGDSTVTNLNAAEGAQIVDESGNPVTVIVDGQTVVSGTGSCTVTVTGSYGTSVTSSEANVLSTSFIDRTSFDSCYSLSTGFGTNSSVSAAAVSSAASTAASVSASSAAQSVSDTTAAPYAAAAGCAAVLAAAGGLMWARRRKTR